MKAFVVDHYGEDGLAPADIPTPTPGRNDVLVDIRAASINPLDKMVRNGEFKQLLQPISVSGRPILGLSDGLSGSMPGYGMPRVALQPSRVHELRRFADT
ncbi:hypothetical protein [Nocardia sp. NPDC049526]|uniref:hypothetical protein n=1 Tax=Nocardia sp. NPDC049526 TaxID=3364316 RepID=UPI00378F0546